VAFRFFLTLVLVVGTAWTIWECVRPGPRPRTERLRRVGLALAAMGAFWTVFAWWMVVPELILLVGLVLLLVSRRPGVGR
jgi:uncharacterized membrane protein